MPVKFAIRPDSNFADTIAAVKAIDGSSLSDGDTITAQVIGGATYHYSVDTTAGISEASPFILVPSTNPGNISLILIQDPAKFYANFGATDQGAD